MLNRPEAAPGLVECVRQRTSDIPAQSRKAAPIWVPAMLLAGRIQAREAVPAIAAVLADKAAGLDALIAAVRALGRIGDSTAVPAVEAMLKRDDLPRHRVLQKSSGVAADVVEDCLWQVELAAAETLARLGTLRPDLVDRHRSDPRAYVRRYAEKVQQELQRK
jgi:HEAT repeat protein